MAWMDDHGGKLWAAVISAMMGGAALLVRTIFTNHKRLDLLEQKTDMQHAETVREFKAIREDVADLKHTNDTAIETQSKIVEILNELRGNHED